MKLNDNFFQTISIMVLPYDSGFPKLYKAQSYRIVVYSAWLLGIVFIGIYTGNLVAALSTMKGKPVKFNA